MALALLAGSLPVAAQYCPQNGEVPYRTREVKAATLDRVFRDVYKINPNYYYQLQVNPSSLGIKSEDDKTGSFIEKSQFQYVLTVERDYSTGKLYLTAQKVTDATLTHSLWQIETTGREANSRVFKFVNKETGFELSFDHYNALQRVNNKYYIPSLAQKNAGASQYTDNKANFGWTYEKDGLLDGCNFNWAWYTTDDNGNTAFPYKALFSYYHANQDSVMYLKAVKSADLTANNNIAKETYAALNVDGNSRRQLELGLSENGLTGDANYKEGFAIVAAKDSKSNAQNYLAKATDALQIRPVVAGAKVLDADEINRMVDADASLLKFNPNVAKYDVWANASNATDSKDDEKLYTKFTLLEPGGKEALTVAGVNPLGYDFKAIQNPLNALDRKSYNTTKTIPANGSSSEKSIYAGYNILFQTTEPIDQAGNQKKYGYLAVHEHNYENTESGVYNGLQVVVQEYATLGKAAGTAKATRNNYLNVNDAWDKDPAASKYVPDALEARYHWKVTYYATNDSLVLEPLNASRMKQSDMDNKVAFEKTHLATVAPQNFFNTINAGTAYTGATVTDAQNSMYNKAEGVPVALYAMNNSSVGDTDYLITVGPAANKAMNVNANEATWAARSKFGDETVLTSRNNPAYVTNAVNSRTTVTTLAQAKAISYQSEMKLLLRFDHKYTWLKRATVPTGLYYINLQSKKVGNNQQHTENREFGAYIVEDFKGHVVYDASQKEQDFSHMPATQWVVEQQPCTVNEASGMLNYNKYPTVRIYNREFANCAFDGQLYQDREDANKLFTINHREYRWLNSTSTVDKHTHYKLNCADTIAFQKVANPTTLGYFNADEDILRENVYRFQQMYNMTLDQFLGIQNLSAQMDTLKLLPETADGLSCEFELFRAEGWYPEAETYEYFENGVKKTDYTRTYKFHYSDSLKYGYANDDANAPQLYKTYYKVKLKDANLIDNDHRFLAIKNQHKYVIAREADIQNPANNLQFAIVSLKENNCLNGEHGYAIVNAERYTLINNAFSDKLEGLYRTYVVDEYSNKYEVYFFKGAVSADKFKEFEADMSKEDVWTYAEAKTFGKVIRPVGPANNPNGNWDVTGRNNTYNYHNAEGKLLVEPITLEAKVSTSCETVSDVFALVQSNRPLYRDLAATGYADLVNNSKKAIDIKTVDIQGNESLIEDSHSQQASFYKMNYLGAENYGDPSKNEGFYVDFVQASKDSRMPQYMFVVAADSVPAYTYCDCDIHDVKHGINSDCGHSENYAGYVDGRFLVNFNDSVKAAIDKLIPGVDKFAFDNYTRLGFVEAVHRGDSLYVLKAPYTLESIKEASVDPADNGKKFINPLYLSKDSLGKVYDIVPLNGKHNNVAFALRNTEDAEGSFVIESNDLYNDPETGLPQSKYSKIGSFAGAWIKIHNNVPVLAKFYDKNGDHNTGDTTDSWLNMGDWAPVANGDEVINQAARFTFSAIEKDSQATANEEISAGSVVVAGTNGAVVVKGAEGKNVIVSTILGKVVANEVVSSDNATIAAPQGVVVVSVDGESFKVVVK